MCYGQYHVVGRTNSIKRLAVQNQTNNCYENVIVVCYTLLGLCMVELTLHNGREKLGHGKSLFIIAILYVSHFFSAWVSTISK